VTRLFDLTSSSPGHRLLVALIGAALLAVGSAQAQPADSTELRRFRRADSFLQSEEYEKAIEILESLYEQSPDNSAFYRKLKDAYESVKRYDDAIQLVEARIDQNATPQLIAEKARLQYQKGDEEAADRTWSAAIDRAPRRATTYRLVYQSLLDVRRFRRAIEVLQSARTQLEDDTLFRTELARLYGLDGRHRKAMQEYVALLDENPDRLALVRSRLQGFVDRGEGVEAGTSVLETAVENQPLNTAYRELLAWLYMSTDDYEAAYDVYRALDRLQQSEGRRLYAFAQKAADADQFSVATTALEVVLERYPDAEVAAQARRTLGDTYRRWASPSSEATSLGPDSSARYDAARRAYRTFLEEHPSHEARPEVLVALGSLELDVYRALDRAQATLKRVVSSDSSAAAADEARYDLARIALFRGNLERAELLFSRLADQAGNDALADRARFELARLQFYQGRFDAAAARAQTTSADPSADVANDAIELSVLIQENRGPDSLDAPLRQYARAQLDMRRRQFDAATARLDSLLRNHGRHALADQARFERARVELALGDTSRAQETLRTLPRRHPRSPYADRSLYRRAQLHEAQGQPEAAISLYNRLLSEYPKSLLAADARTRLRTLRRSHS